MICAKHKTRVAARDAILKAKRPQERTSVTNRGDVKGRRLPNRLAPLDFALEDELLWVLHDVAHSRLVKARGVLVSSSCKFQVGTIIPDLLLVTVENGCRHQSRRLLQMTHFDCVVLADLLNVGPSHRRAVTSRIYAQPATLDKSLNRLLRWRLVVRKPDGTFAGRRRVLPSGLRVISVEAKLRRWKDALGQAKRYLNFSNSSFVALPESLIHKNWKIEATCATEGIGLIGVTPNRAKLIRPATWQKPLTADWLWIVGRTVGFTDRSPHNGNAVEVKAPASHPRTG